MGMNGGDRMGDKTTLRRKIKSDTRKARILKVPSA